MRHYLSLACLILCSALMAAEAQVDLKPIGRKPIRADLARMFESLNIPEGLIRATSIKVDGAALDWSKTAADLKVNIHLLDWLNRSYTARSANSIDIKSLAHPFYMACNTKTNRISLMIRDNLVMKYTYEVQKSAKSIAPGNYELIYSLASQAILPDDTSLEMQPLYFGSIVVISRKLLDNTNYNAIVPKKAEWVIVLEEEAYKISSYCLAAKVSYLKVIDEDLNSKEFEPAYELLKAMQVETALKASINAMVDQQVKQDPTLAPYRKILFEFLSKYTNWDILKEDMIRSYSEAFTEQELKELALFYRTPLGQKAALRLPQLMDAEIGLGMKQAQQHMPELRQMIEEEAKRIPKIREELPPNAVPTPQPQATNANNPQAPQPTVTPNDAGGKDKDVKP